MLCPKCGYISFDNLTSCSKCQNDLSTIKEELQGTTVQVEKNFFLGSPTAADQEQPVEVDDYVEAEGMGDEAPPAAINETDSSLGGPALDLEDMPPIDLSEIDHEHETVQEENVPALDLEGSKSMASEETLEEETKHTEPLDLDLQPEEESVDEIEMPVDEETLTLEIDDQSVDLAMEMNQPVEPEKEEEGGKDDQIPIDLEQIDLSDLIHSPAHAPDSASKQNIEESAAEEHGEADLTLEMEAGGETEDQEDSLLEPLDLTLELDETEYFNLSP